MNDQEKKLFERWGVRLPAREPLLQAGFKPRETDVLIATAPKSGCTWMQTVLYQLKQKGRDFDDIYALDTAPWLELRMPIFETIERQLQAYETETTNPRIFKTHLPEKYLPHEIAGTKSHAKVISVTRDPRDTMVSWWHHSQALSDEAKKEFPMLAKAWSFSFDECFDSSLDTADYWPITYGWWKLRNEPWVLLLRFADIKENPRREMEKILKFLDWPQPSEDEWARILEFTSFQWMKSNLAKYNQCPFSKNKIKLWKEGQFIRKGQVGDHKTLLSAEQEQRVLDKARSFSSNDEDYEQWIYTQK
eukprot:TRINITY_DN4815_c0_g1_i1.p1 TRINITY_DN4815_c0_g1~~TRINITY_DN4815_c0_g1_i1.p1  ORF type:complete len:322 (+),score=47.40 TRINITY_DN4815_c0_g1_i1:53-967(+)